VAELYGKVNMLEDPQVQKLYSYESEDEITIEDCLNIEYKRCMDYWYPDIEYKYYPLKAGYSCIKFTGDKTVPQDELEAKVLEATKIIISGGKVQFAERGRKMRDMLLKETDWVSGEDTPQSIKDTWFPYRQALRDITTQEGWPLNIVWPEKPL
jgi:hypothetical protein